MENIQRQFIMALLAYAVQRDVNPAQLCSLAGIDYKAIHQHPDFHITPQQQEQLWKQASQVTRDPLFGLHFGESLQLAALGVVGQIIQTSATISEALTNACALVKLTTDMFDMQIRHGKNSFSIHLLTDKKMAASYPFTYRHTADYLMVFVIHEMDGLLLEKTIPVEVSLPYYQAEPYEYTRVFRCAAVRRDDAFVLEFPARYLELPVLSANYELQHLLLQKMNTLLQHSAPAAGWRNRIYNYLLTNSYLHTLSLEAVARNFNMSTRSLQRKLKEEGCTYLEIVDEVRKNLAINYLTNRQLSVKDVTHILGYNEQSAFLRAFKRWTGGTPGSYRKKAEAGNRPAI